MLFDAIVVGQGLAGTSLAWELLRCDAHTLVLDRESGHSASRVAAGLVTPVTGRALSSPPGFARDRRIAASHYQSVARVTGTKLWHERGALRLFASPADVARWEKRQAELAAVLVEANPAPAAGFAPMQRAALMPGAARLDVVRYLDTSRAAFRERGCYERCNVDTNALEIHRDSIALDGGRLRARCVILCGGSDDAGGAWLTEGALSPAKGEIITVQIEDFYETRTAHCAGHWLLPTTQRGTYRFGATYDHDDSTPVATPAARLELETRLSAIVTRPFEVLDQQVGVRPVGAQRRPVVGAHPVHRRVVVFNGLGSRGVLWAPGIARRLAASLKANAYAAGPDVGEMPA